jgi:hypothetical protein
MVFGKTIQALGLSSLKANGRLSKGSGLARAFLLAAAALTAGSDRGAATEVGLFAGPLGGSDIRSAYLPPVTGLYAATIALGTSYNALSDNNGNELTTPQGRLNGIVGGVAAMYVYPFKIDGGTLATSVTQPGAYIQEKVGPRRQTDSGLVDTYADLLTYSKYLGVFGARAPEGPSKLPYGLTFAASYSMVFPTGRYKVTDLAVEGHNYFVYIPNIAFTYLTGPNLSIGQGTEISARLFYDIPTINPANNYQSGQVIDLDWGVSERLGLAQMGLAGNYAFQLNPDRLNGNLVAVNGNKLERATIGPVFAYDIPELRATFKTKVLVDYIDRNTFSQRITASVSLAFKLF